ncbi:2-amino-4-hydroxy-6-hydroxymethyldihydropteridine diphosphokinase [Porticoccus sp. W117]|uniref:2-amino-4-hydroxy-6- hydroxymethyldihydropteridine diphosphokinase n=1 Tax=Porticoccus sp. W117 TaxID=3054777 RepID=UPI002595D32A|nr:2-amino-4-hydroxy-6-hydroxymethyldihydropteridine diphosphokinase [Porticoccus sp. W117]MDM3870232.1 2-amino-4-hydroxy-6-hydroxymethyldihydropteridine diphosphokinase [Porticoccus sp. W117]
MVTAYLGIGSNQNRSHNIRAALQWLEHRYDSLQTSPVYESEPVGVECERFYNLVVAMQTEQPLAELHDSLRQLEQQQGRCRNTDDPCHSLDVDILLYGDVVGTVGGIVLPRPEILSNAYVLKPMSDLAPELTHPEVEKTYKELWQEYNRPQKLWPVEIN